MPTTSPPIDLDALARIARLRLSQGDFDTAFAFADRRCRMIVPSARDLLLRAQANRAAGRTDAAQSDLSAAVALDPTDLEIDRAALAWGDDAARAEAARRLADRAALARPLRRKAVAALFAAGARLVHRLRRTERGVAGWIAWADDAPLRIEMSGAVEPLEFPVESDPDHPLRGAGIAAADVAVETAEPGSLTLALRLGDGAAEQIEPERAPRPAPRREHASASPAGEGEPFVMVIAPVFEDFEATRLCLDAFAAAPPAIAHELVVVDDASPNAAIRAYLDEAAARGAFTLIRNPENLGFAAAVNAALARRTYGDALLLNADAALPAGAVDRLHGLSRSSPGIGTVTPFCNNGELTSYPLRNEANPMPSLAEIGALDALARKVNGDALIDAPNGVGFCLYITAACLDAIGGLPELYAQGYFEDVEFCLAARERGFRNVIAPGVFVGHAGSKSFTTRKQALVMRNLQLIETRFPGYRLETAAFVALDPLKTHRAALDAVSPPAGPVAIVASGPGAARALGRRRAETLKAERPELIVLTIAATRGATLAIAAVGGGAPQSLSFDFAAGEAPAFAAYIAKLDLRHMEWLDPTSLPDAALEALSGLAAEVDLLCADLNWFTPPAPPLAGRCVEPASEGPCETCRRQAAPRRDDEGDDPRRLKLGRALERAHRIVPLDRLAESFALRVFKSRAVRFEAARPAASSGRAGAALGRLGVLYPHRAPEVDRLLLRLGRALAARGSTAELTVFGVSLDDAALMGTGKIFVAGPVAAADYAPAARAYGVDALLAPQRGGGYGDLEATASALDAPKAYFDWSFGAFAVEWGDLSLDPRICEDKAAAEIVAWLNGERRVQS